MARKAECDDKNNYLELKELNYRFIIKWNGANAPRQKYERICLKEKKGS